MNLFLSPNDVTTTTFARKQSNNGDLLCTKYTTNKVIFLPKQKYFRATNAHSEIKGTKVFYLSNICFGVECPFKIDLNTDTTIVLEVLRR